MRGGSSIPRAAGHPLEDAGANPVPRSLKRIVELAELKAWLDAENDFIEAVMERTRLHAGDVELYLKACERVGAALVKLQKARFPLAFLLARNGIDVVPRSIAVRLRLEELTGDSDFGLTDRSST